MENPTAEKETLEAILKKAQGNPGVEPGSEAAFSPAQDADFPAAGTRGGRGEFLKGVQLKVRVELGRAKLRLRDAMALGPGAVVDLEKLVDDPVDLYVNDLLVARGEVMVVGGNFCVRITEVHTPEGGEEN
jgi:flagellar motor switch protein FliN/FliY